MALYALEPLSPLPNIVKENFVSDRDYTHDRIIEQSAILELRLRDGTWKLNTCDEMEVINEEITDQLDLMILHLSDGSWKLCRCNPEKHLPLISGLASEGFGFAKSPEEKQFMKEMRDRARIWRAKIKSGTFNDKHADQLRAWARSCRHRVEFQQWSGVMAETPELEEVVTQVHALTGGIAVLEEEQVDRILTELSRKHGIPKPSYRFVEGCNPLKDAWMVGRDLISKNEDGEVTRVPLTDTDQLVFCKGGASGYAVSHEFCHYLQRVKEGKTDEKTATACALEEVGNESHIVYKAKGLNNISTEESSGGIMSFKLSKLTERVTGVLPLIGGVVVGEAIDASGMIDSSIMGFTGAWTGLAKGILGAIIAGTGAGMKKSAMADVILGIGLPIAVSGFTQQFFPGGIFPTARAVVVTPGTTVMPVTQPRLTSYARPTGLRAGHPTLMVPHIPPRPGILAPSGIPQSLAGKFVLGNR